MKFFGKILGKNKKTKSKLLNAENQEQLPQNIDLSNQIHQSKHSTSNADLSFTNEDSTMDITQLTNFETTIKQKKYLSSLHPIHQIPSDPLADLLEYNQIVCMDNKHLIKVMKKSSAKNSFSKAEEEPKNKREKTPEMEFDSRRPKSKESLKEIQNLSQ